MLLLVGSKILVGRGNSTDILFTSSFNHMKSPENNWNQPATHYMALVARVLEKKCYQCHLAIR